MKRKFSNAVVGVILEVALGLGWSLPTLAQGDPLPSWNDTPAKQAIVELSVGSPNPAALILSRPRNVLRPSITMARSGSSSRCTSKWPSRSIG